MTIGLLIITLILILILMVLPIVVTLVVSKKEKDKENYKRIISVSLIVDAITLIILLSLLATPIKNNDLKITNSDNSSETTTESEETEDELSEAGFNEVTLSEYLGLIKSADKQIILVARPTCYYCQQFTPILKQAKEEMNLTINYINTDNLSKDDWTTFQESLDYLNSEEWGTPLTLIVQNEEVLDSNNGYVELETIKDFFSKNGLGE